MTATVTVQLSDPYGIVIKEFTMPESVLLASSGLTWGERYFTYHGMRDGGKWRWREVDAPTPVDQWIDVK